MVADARLCELSRKGVLAGVSPDHIFAGRAETLKAEPGSAVFPQHEPDLPPLVWCRCRRPSAGRRRLHGHFGGSSDACQQAGGDPARARERVIARVTTEAGAEATVHSLAELQDRPTDGLRQGSRCWRRFTPGPGTADRPDSALASRTGSHSGVGRKHCTSDLCRRAIILAQVPHLIASAHCTLTYPNRVILP